MSEALRFLGGRPMWVVEPRGYETDCWIYQGWKNADGYGQKRNGPRFPMAHRWVYEKLRGPIPEGLTLDHLCRVRDCVNPDHLEPVTNRENTMRGDTLPAMNAAKTHCKQGHRLAGENLRIDPRTGHRCCRACARENAARHREAKRALA